MAKLTSLATTWNTIKEIDLRPLRQSAMKDINIVLTGQSADSQERLAEQIRHDPSRPGLELFTPIRLVDLESVSSVNADLIIIVIDAKPDQSEEDFTIEKNLVKGWSTTAQKVLVVFNQVNNSENPSVNRPIPGYRYNWRERCVVHGSVEDSSFLQNEFAKAVMDLLPADWLAMGRNYPLFRQSIATQLINETCLSNAAYALSTGLAEIVPILDIPLNLTDFVVLTKTQAFLVYKLGLALGLSLDWQNYVTEFGGVLGVGFLWRQLARSLVGLIPAYGILPKIGIAYAGTYVSGHVVLQWYLTGRRISSQQMRALYALALVNGKQAAQSLLEKMPRPKVRRPMINLPKLSRPKLNWPKRRTPAAPALPETVPSSLLTQVCTNCGQASAFDAHFCQYCGLPLIKKAAHESEGQPGNPKPTPLDEPDDNPPKIEP